MSRGGSGAVRRSGLVLIGLPGSGKSTVGALLADRLGLPFVDLDAVIEQHTGRSIADIFADDGEAAFRELEQQLATDALRRPAVIALGGGAVVSPALRHTLESHEVVWLRTSVGEAARRVGDTGHRPLLCGGVRERLEQLLAEREPWYEQVAKHRVLTDGKNPQQVTAMILEDVAGPVGSEPAPLVRIIVESKAQPYPVLIGRGALDQLPSFLDGGPRVALIYSDVLAKPARRAAQLVADAGAHPLLLEVPAGEAGKTVETVGHCWNQLAAAGFTRSDLVIGIGGGATTDLAGFVAATWLRGVRFICVPTTILGMVDAAVGGKTGIDLPRSKNLVGAFHEPTAVLADLELLGGLPDSEVRSGLGEVIKCGFIADPRILDLVRADPAECLDVSSPRLTELIRLSVEVKAKVVSEDLREATSTADHVGREQLNYGHTLGHAIEAHEQFQWRHGAAVGVGMVFAAELAHRLVGLDQSVLDLHRATLGSIGLPTSYAAASFDELRRLMALDKKTRGATLRFVGLRSLGQVTIIANPSESVLRECYRAIAE